MSTVPDAPIAVIAARNGSGGALVTFSPPVNDGGSVITLYTITALPSAGVPVIGTGNNSPVGLTGLVNGTSYTFTVVATNENGDSVDSDASAPLIVAAVPDPPISLSASIDNGQSSVSFSPPADNGGLSITSYTVHATDVVVDANGGQTATGTASPLVVTGLTNGDGYTFTVTATNGAGTSAPSGSSGIVVPTDNSTPQQQAPYPNAASFRVHKRIGQLQFEAELHQALQEDVIVSVVNDSPFSLDATIWIVPNTVDQTIVQTVIDNHVFDPNYGIPAYIAEFNAVLIKVSNDPNVTLSTDDIQAAVKGMLARFSSGAMG